MSIQAIIDKHPGQIAKFIDDGDLDQDLFDVLYEHYLNNGEMPYGTAKARTGDPYEWVSERLSLELS